MAEMHLGVSDQLIEDAGDVLPVVRVQPAVVEVIDQAEQFLMLGIDDVIADCILV